MADQKEACRIRDRLAAVNPENERLYRINAGMGWAGKVVRNVGGVMTLKNPRPFHAAPENWPDMCGWQTVEITPEMVGKRIAVVKFIEVKVTGGLTPGQAAFRKLVLEMGGIHEVDRG